MKTKFLQTTVYSWVSLQKQSFLQWGGKGLKRATIDGSRVIHGEAPFHPITSSVSDVTIFRYDYKNRDLSTWRCTRFSAKLSGANWLFCRSNALHIVLVMTYYVSSDTELSIFNNVTQFESKIRIRSYLSTILTYYISHFNSHLLRSGNLSGN